MEAKDNDRKNSNDLVHDSAAIRITIPLAPITKKNSQEIHINRSTGKCFISPSRQYREYAAAAMTYCHGVSDTICSCVNVKALFYMPTMRKCDLTNLLEAVDDILVKASILDDDNCRIIGGHDGSRVYVDKQSPRTEIYIETMKNEK